MAQRQNIWCFTLHKVDRRNAILEKLPTSKVLAFQWQLETAPTTGKPHYQGWLRLPRGYGRDEIFGLLGEGFGKAFKCRGSMQDQILYCSKPGAKDRCFYPVTDDGHGPRGEQVWMHGTEYECDIDIVGWHAMYNKREQERKERASGEVLIIPDEPADLSFLPNLLPKKRKRLSPAMTFQQFQNEQEEKIEKGKESS